MLSERLQTNILRRQAALRSYVYDKRNLAAMLIQRGTFSIEPFQRNLAS